MKHGIKIWSKWFVWTKPIWLIPMFWFQLLLKQYNYIDHYWPLFLRQVNTKGTLTRDEPIVPRLRLMMSDAGRNTRSMRVHCRSHHWLTLPARRTCEKESPGEWWYSRERTQEQWASCAESAWRYRDWVTKRNVHGVPRIALGTIELMTKESPLGEGGKDPKLLE